MSPVSRERIIAATSATIQLEQALEHLKHARAHMVSLQIQGDGVTRIDEALMRTQQAIAHLKIVTKRIP